MTTYEIPTPKGYQTVQAGSKQEAYGLVPDRTVAPKSYQDNQNGTTTYQLSDGTTSTVSYNKLADGSLQPIEGARLGTTTPINIPTLPAQNYSANLGMANNSAVGEIQTQANQPDVTQSANDKGWLKSSLQKLTDTIMGQSSQESALKSEYQVQEKKQKAQGIANELDQLDKSFQDEVKNIRKNSEGKFGGAVEQDVANAQMRYEDRRANIALAYKVANQDYQGAEELVNQKVDSLRQQNNQALQLFNMQKDMVYNNLTESEKILANEQSQIRANKAKQNEETYANMLKFATLNKAPASVLSAIDQAAKEPNATPASIMNAAGKYGVDTASALDIQYKRAQIGKLNSESSGVAGDNPQLYKGLNSSTATAVRGVVGGFKSEPLVTNFTQVQDAKNFVGSISSDTKNPADDQALIYSLAKALDPNSVVREGEYATAQKYAQSWVKAYGKSVTQAVNGTGFLSKEARDNIKTVINTKYNSSKTSYDNLTKQYANQINNLTGRSDGDKFLRDYTTDVKPTEKDPLGLGI